MLRSILNVHVRVGSETLCSRATEMFVRLTHPRSMSSCSGGCSSCSSRCSSSPRGGGGGKASIQVRDGVLTAFPMAFCLGFPIINRSRESK